MTDNLALLAQAPDIEKTAPMFSHPDCRSLFENYNEHEQKAGYNPPWTGYLVIRNDQAVGCCAFTGPPVDNKVEIAYWTFSGNEGQGIASFACRELIAISKDTDPNVIITAKTTAENNASTKILENNGFKFTGVVPIENEGDFWDWLYAG